jgi:hypothetical protein
MIQIDKEDFIFKYIEYHKREYCFIEKRKAMTWTSFPRLPSRVHRNVEGSFEEF